MASKKNKHSDFRAITYPGHFNLPTVLTDSPDFTSLSGSALKLLVEIGRQYNGVNNGDLCIVLSLLKQRGWTSNNLINRAKRELTEKNLIVETRKGGMGFGPSLYAITWQPINVCKGKHDAKPTLSAPRSFRGYMAAQE